MPPPQCPECGRFLATAFVQQLAGEPAPCPRCGTELSLADGAPTSGAAPADEMGGAPGAPVLDDESPSPPPADLADVAPEPMTSVRPPDRDPLDGWDQGGNATAPTPDEFDPAVVAAGAGAGLLLGLLLAGRDHRGLGALLGAVLGAVIARLRG